jgi:hypothetical protein
MDAARERGRGEAADMQTRERQDTGRLDGDLAVTKAPSWLIAVVVVLSVALVALAAWVVVDRSGDTTPSPAEVTTIVDRSIEAWDAGDRGAILELYADDATFDVGRTVTGAEAIADYVEELDGLGFTVEARSATVVAGNTGVTAVAFGVAGDLSPLVAVIEVNDDGKIVTHTGEDMTDLKVLEG